MKIISWNVKGLESYKKNASTKDLQKIQNGHSHDTRHKDKWKLTGGVYLQFAIRSLEWISSPAAGTAGR